jgi:predicted transcriptional regulator
MAERKTEAVNFRFTPSMKELLRFIAAREHRTQSNMIERMMLDYCERNGIDVNEALRAGTAAGKSSLPHSSSK